MVECRLLKSVLGATHETLYAFCSTLVLYSHIISLIHNVSDAPRGMTKIQAFLIFHAFAPTKHPVSVVIQHFCYSCKSYAPLTQLHY